VTLLFSTNNTTTGTPLARAGICNGMTAAWARLSLQNNGCSAGDKTQIEAGGLLLATRVRLSLTGILDATTAVQWTTMLSTIGLTPTYRTSKAFGGSIGLGSELLKYGSATAYIVITFAGGIHAMGARVSPTTCDFFDPNTGLNRDNTPGAFLASMNQRMQGYQGWMTNQTHIWTLL
jgi:hypothetical protein